MEDGEMKAVTIARCTCGAEPTVCSDEAEDPCFWVECPACGEAGYTCKNKGIAVESWNRHEHLDDGAPWDYGDDHSHY
jgi:hypothetical protein